MLWFLSNTQMGNHVFTKFDELKVITWVTKYGYVQFSTNT